MTPPCHESRVHPVNMGEPVIDHVQTARIHPSNMGESSLARPWSEWNVWSDKVPDWEYPVAEEKPKFAQLVIPTLDSVRLEVEPAGHRSPRPRSPFDTGNEDSNACR